MADEMIPVAQTFKPVEEFVISDLETLKVLADPLRLSILEYLRKPGTVKQIAEKINKPPTKLYYHFNLLEKHQLIQTVDTRIVSGIVEKHYQAAAKNYHVARDLLSPGNAEFGEGLEVTLGGLFGDTRNDLRESFLAGAVKTSDDAPKHERILLVQGRINLTTDRAKEFYERLDQLIKEFNADEEEDTSAGAELLPYKILVLVHPSSRGDVNREDDAE